AFDRKRAQKRRHLYRLFSPGTDPHISINNKQYQSLGYAIQLSSNLRKRGIDRSYTAGVSAIGRIRRFARQMETSMNFVKTIVAAGLVAASTSAFAADITGAGATFPFPIYSKWADA